MNLLALETSSSVLSVALKKSGAKIRHASVEGAMKHAENLLPIIDRLLKKEKLKIGDIDTFLIGRGPGSFTGLRIGFSTLKGFLAVRPKPCYGAFSLDVIASGTHPSKNRSLQGENLTVCLDARRGKLYTRSYRHFKKRWIPCGPSRVLSADGTTAELLRGHWVIGDGFAKINPEGLNALSEKIGIPRAATLIELFEAKDPLLKKLARPKDFLPAYFRLSEPEEKLKDKARKNQETRNKIQPSSKHQ